MKGDFLKFFAVILVTVSIFLPWVWITRWPKTQWYWIYLIGATLEGNPKHANLFETELWRELMWWRPLSFLFMTVSLISGLSFIISCYKGARFKKAKILSLVSGFMALAALCPCFYFYKQFNSQPPGSYSATFSYGIILTFLGALIWFVNYAIAVRGAVHNGGLSYLPRRPACASIQTLEARGCVKGGRSFAAIC